MVSFTLKKYKMILEYNIGAKRKLVGKRKSSHAQEISVNICHLLPQ